MVDYVTDLARQLGPWGYVIVYVVVMLECQPLLGLFMPGETLVVASGFIARSGAFDLRLLIPIVASPPSWATPSALNSVGAWVAAGCNIMATGSVCARHTS